MTPRPMNAALAMLLPLLLPGGRTLVGSAQGQQGRAGGVAKPARPRDNAAPDLHL